MRWKKTLVVSRKSYTPEQITSKVREAEVLLSKNQTIGQICWKPGERGACTSTGN